MLTNFEKAKQLLKWKDDNPEHLQYQAVKARVMEVHASTYHELCHVYGVKPNPLFFAPRELGNGTMYLTPKQRQFNAEHSALFFAAIAKDEFLCSITKRC